MKWQVTEQGPRAIIEVWRADDGEGLFKAYIQGPTGRCLLGTLVPEGNRLFLRRTLTIDSLRRQGTWPIKTVELDMICSFRESPHQTVRWEDEVLCRSAQNLPGHTLRREGEGFSLIFPFDPRTPFPLTPAFCFARVENGRLIFSFRAGGIPYISQNQGNPKGEVEEKRRDPHGKFDHQGTRCAGGSAGI